MSIHFFDHIFLTIDHIARNYPTFTRIFTYFIGISIGMIGVKIVQDNLKPSRIAIKSHFNLKTLMLIILAIPVYEVFLGFGFFKNFIASFEAGPFAVPMLFGMIAETLVIKLLSEDTRLAIVNALLKSMINMLTKAQNWASMKQDDKSNQEDKDE